MGRFYLFIFALILLISCQVVSATEELDESQTPLVSSNPSGHSLQVTGYTNDFWHKADYVQAKIIDDYQRKSRTITLQLIAAKKGVAAILKKAKIPDHLQRWRAHNPKIDLYKQRVNIFNLEVSLNNTVEVIRNISHLKNVLSDMLYLIKLNPNFVSVERVAKINMGKNLMRLRKFPCLSSNYENLIMSIDPSLLEGIDFPVLRDKVGWLVYFLESYHETAIQEQIQSPDSLGVRWFNVQLETKQTYYISAFYEQLLQEIVSTQETAQAAQLAWGFFPCCVIS